VIERKSFGTARARVGYAFNNFLPYVTGGVAYGKFFAGLGTVPSLAGSDVIRTEWAAGAGVEYALSANWSVKAEYLYVDLGSYVYGAFVGTPFTAEDGRFHVIRAGLNYKLGGI
jgi:outer membrane immunogenic protein